MVSRPHSGSHAGSHSNRRLLGAAGVALAVFSLGARQACADDFDTFNILAGSLLRYDSNVFRVPDNAAPQSDIINVSNIGASFDKSYSLQRVILKGTNTYTKYASNEALNNNALNYSATWLWAVTPHLTGTLGSDRQQTQIPFALVGGNQRNILTIRNDNFSFDATVSGAWHLFGGYGETTSTTEQPVLTVPSQRYHRTEGGLRYVSRAGNTISAIYRYIPTTLTDQPLTIASLIDTNYRDTERELRGDWRVTGKSTVIGRLVWKQRSNEHFHQRDFSGTGGELRYIWAVTGKTQINVAVTRDYLPYAAFGNVLENSTYRIDDTFALNGLWQATAKTAVHATLARTLSDFRGPVFFPLTGPLREDTLTSAQLGADWAISRSVLLSANLQHDQRNSNQQQFQFRNNSLLFGAALKF